MNDKLPQASPIKGRGTAVRIAHRFERDLRAGFDDGWGTLDQDAQEERLLPATTVIEERAKSVVASNDSPDIPFGQSLNPYRGCEHGCIYCYARPTHSYLNLSPGLDFETKIVAKINAAERLEEELARPKYRASTIHIGGATDAYQPIERRLRITRGVLEVLARCEHAFSIVTKSSGIERDLDLIGPAARAGRAWVSISVTTLDGPLARVLEPRAAAPHRRMQTVAALAQAGVPVGVNVAPIIPFINEPEIERIVESAAQAGAKSIHYTVLRLPWEVSPLFRQWLHQHFPERAERVMARVQEMHGGQDYKADFGSRMKGEGVWAQLIAQRIDKAVGRAGLTRHVAPLDEGAFRPPQQAGQGSLF
ncbi:PA0069 family radical SAM protein [Schlegelella sp. S2-27]|uniref:PA0069 family radical SAM protein n=1 Tax=Caldimonas mangrovi TaxID=2944811 RepID=A0ABT0YM68_9BURK|nr:PA0069 family radical SAM protein [Caldimonas mangrovi]MCM5679826.1 PA0069 family radical SAM protein [Caldimonas mangrovi]